MPILGVHAKEIVSVKPTTAGPRKSQSHYEDDADKKYRNSN